MYDYIFVLNDEDLTRAWADGDDVSITQGPNNDPLKDFVMIPRDEAIKLAKAILKELGDE